MIEKELLIKLTVDTVVEILKLPFTDLFDQNRNFEENFHETLSEHMRMIQNWSSHFQFLEMPRPRDINSNTVMLSIHTAPQKFHGGNNKLTDETIFLHEPNHYILLGDPGSGKTTTLKRLVRRFFEKPPQKDTDILQYPIVILLRKYNPNLGLLKTVAEAIGIQYEDIKENDSDGRIVCKTLIGKEPIRNKLSKILDASLALLILDGLDEVSYFAFDELVTQINDLAQCLDTSKILLTCRSGDFTRTLEGFRVLELAELTTEQIEKIAEIWYGDPEPFMKAFKSVPYQDIANRPILLALLLCIFGFEEELPDEPHKIYRKTTTFLLHEWDRSRGIKRKTRYSRFDPDSKLDFLSALSYELTYKIKTKRFSEFDLITCYKRLSKRYSLPDGQAAEVAREIETHSGIISAVNNFEFEFSHLSLQEYLCANHIVREPRAGQIPNYIREYPPPLAIAIALSAEPSTWFADLILRFGDKTYFSERSLNTFLSRLGIEKPRFEPSAALGYAVLKLIFNFYEIENPKLRVQLEMLLDLQYLTESINLGLKSYWIEKSRSEPGDYFYLVWQNAIDDSSVGGDMEFKPPNQGRFKKELLLKILAKSTTPINWCEQWGSMGSRFRLDGKRYYYA
jgi:hypothetical protein